MTLLDALKANPKKFRRVGDQYWLMIDGLGMVVFAPREGIRPGLLPSRPTIDWLLGTFEVGNV